MSIFSIQKSIIPLFSSKSRCYNTHTSRATPKCKSLQVLFKENSQAVFRTTFRRYNMSFKNSVKNYLENMLEEYGEILIRADRA